MPCRLALWPALAAVLVVSASAPSSAQTDRLTKTPNHVYVASFNVYKLGSVDPKYTAITDWTPDPGPDIPDRIANVARVIAVGGFHLVVLQEVTSGERGYYALRDLVEALYVNHGMRYRFFLSDYIGRGLMPEAIGFLYRRHAVRYVPIDGQRSALIPIPGRDLVKTQWIARDLDFTLVAAHLAWSNESHRDAGYQKIEEILTDPSSFSDDPDVIVLGDLNRFGAGYDSVRELDYDPSVFLAPNVTFFDPDFNQRPNVTRTSIAGKGVPDDNPQLISTTVAQNTRVYDLFLLSADLAEEFGPGQGEATYGVDFGIIHFDEPSGFGFMPGAHNLAHDPLKRAYSDHRPLWFRFRARAGASDSTWP